jgi:hypothetical protein
MRKLRLRLLFALAKLLNIPIDVHGSFFAYGTRGLNTDSWSIDPK